MTGTSHALQVRQRLEAAGERCAFVDCCHVAEPGCVVGSDWPRFLHYLSLREEISLREEQQRRMMGTKKEDNTRWAQGLCIDVWWAVGFTFSQFRVWGGAALQLLLLGLGGGERR